MPRCAVILTAYNRPTLVADAIQSVLNQTTDSWRLYIMDDGCNEETRAAIERVIDSQKDCVRSFKRTPADFGDISATTYGLRDSIAEIVWVKMPDRSAADRKRTISYSRSINFALNQLSFNNEEYITFLCDDDFFYPESIDGRMNFMDGTPDCYVCFGRSRSIQYAQGGKYNTWSGAAAPQSGMAFPRPRGQRILHNDGASARCFFEDSNVDPQTGLDHVEEAFWQPGVWRYGHPYRTDHNQVMLRRNVFWMSNSPEAWYGYGDMGGVQFWGEDMAHGVGDKAFFEKLDAHGFPFYACDVWTVTKRFHVYSDGIQSGAKRE